MSEQPLRSENPRQPAWGFALVGLIFVLSGATALVYEVVWTRQLTTFFGSTLYGVATVLSAFMGGLALGSYLLGSRADRMRNPLAVYGWLEIGTGIAALVFPWALRATQPIIGSVYVTGGEQTFLVFSLIRFAIVFLLLLVPTTLMGATLPVMSKAVTTSFSQVGRRVGGLYALNTLGAVLGVFAAGFLLLEMLGVFRTTALAVGLDVLIGVLCIWLGGRYFRVDNAAVVRDTVVSREEATRMRYSPAVLRLVLATYAVSGFVALAYQVCWTRALIFSFETLKATTYSFSAMLMVFLLGLSIGSALMQAIVDRQKNLLRLYALIQMGIGLTAGLSFFVILTDLPAMPELNDDRSLRYWVAVFNVIYRSAAAIGLPTLLMGMAFPVVTRIVVGSIGQLGRDVASVYALNTVGAIVGSFAAGFVLIPTLGITGTIALLAFINLTMAVALVLANQEADQRQRMALATVGILAAIIVPARIAFSGARMQRIQPNEVVVHYEEGAMATISVVENNSGDRMIYVDDVGVAGTDKIMLTDQKSLAHVPMALLGGRANRVLSVGFGSGGASYSYTLYDSIESINTIEIAPEVLRAAPTLTDSNRGIIAHDALVARARAANADRITGYRHPLSSFVHQPAPGFKTFDPRFRVLIDDARSYLRFTKEQYDVIATDCTDLRYKSNANLYDLEYFTLCAEKTTDRGLVVVWMPLAGLSDRAFRSALRTFQVVFPTMSVWFFPNYPTHYCLLIGNKNGMRIDYPAMQAALSYPAIQADLEEIGLRDPNKLLSCFVADERTLTAHLADAPLNTEDHPIIEFESPRYGYDSKPLADNMMAIYRIQVPVADIVDHLPEEEARKVWRLQEANVVLFEGHVAYRLYDFKTAANKYLEALAMVPDDDAIVRLLDFQELRRHYETSKRNPNRNTVIIGQSLAEVFFLQGRMMEAVTYADEVAGMIGPAARGQEDLRPTLFSIYSILAQGYAGAGQGDRARQYLQEARARAANAAEGDSLEQSVRTLLEAKKPTG